MGQNLYTDLVGRYCEMLGYTSYVKQCISQVRLPNGQEVSAVKFFRGEVGQEYSYCALKGYKMGIRKEKSPDYDLSYPVCIKEADGKRSETNLLRVIYDEGDYQKLFPNEPLPIEPPARLLRAPIVGPPIEPDPNLPYNCDYRDSLYFNSTIYTQGSCGKCYSYASVAVGEYVISKALNLPNSIDLSESSIAFCGMNCYPNIIGGCGGIDLLINCYYPLKMMCEQGVLPETAFPDEFSNIPCLMAYWTGNTRYVFNNYVQEQGYLPIQNAIKDHGPLFANLNARTSVWNAYESIHDPLENRTIYVDDRSCIGGKDEELVHSVAIVGWGVDEIKGLYWIIKNSQDSVWGDGGYGYIKASSLKIACNVYHLEYQPRQISFRLVPCDYTVLNTPTSADLPTWRMANNSLYSNTFPVAGTSFLPTLINGNTQTWDTIFCRVNYDAGCTPSYSEPEISQRIWIGKPSVSEINGPTSVGVNLSCLQYVYGEGLETTSYSWSATGNIQIIGSNIGSSCTVKGLSGGLNYGTLTLEATNCFGPTTKTKTIYVDQFLMMAYPNPADSELTVEVSYDFSDTPEIEYRLIDSQNKLQAIENTRNKKITFSTANLLEGLYVLQIRVNKTENISLIQEQKILLKH